MFLKLLVFIIFIASIAVVLLDYRQQRLEMMNEMTRLHGQIDQSRQAMWDLQIKIADHIDPPVLMKAIERAKLKLESTTTVPPPAEAGTAGDPPNPNVIGRSNVPGDIHQTNAPAQRGWVATAE